MQFRSRLFILQVFELLDWTPRPRRHRLHIKKPVVLLALELRGVVDFLAALGKLRQVVDYEDEEEADEELVELLDGNHYPHSRNQERYVAIHNAEEVVKH